MKNIKKTLTIIAIIFIVGVWGIFTDGLIIRNEELRNGIYASLQTKGTSDMVAIINGERKKAGLPGLKENAMLDASAKAKACDMLDKGYFEHFTMDGKTPWDFIRGAGYNYTAAGENLVKGYFGDQESMRRLMASPSHKENILDPRYTEIGIGRCGEYTVQHFGAR